MPAIRMILFMGYGAIVRLLWRTGLGHIPIVEAIHNGIISRLKPEEVRREGLIIKLDRQDNCRLSYANSHDFETAFLCSQIRSGDVVLDIGANIGYYTLLFSRAVGPQGHVYAFEPEPGHFELLRENVSRNGCHNVTLVDKAVSDYSGPAQLFLSLTHGGTHRIYMSRHCGEAIDIEAITLDEFFADHSRSIALIKIDVEGAEPRVLQGMCGLLASNPEAGVFTEFYPGGLAEQGTSPEDYLQQLDTLGFHVLHVNARIGIVEPANIDTLLRQCPVSSRLVTNLWCRRRLPTTQDTGRCISELDRQDG